MNFEQVLKLMVDKGASDLFITAGMPPTLKLNGRLAPVGKEPLSADQAQRLVLAQMSEQQRHEFAAYHECNFAISPTGVGRFRVSAFYQRNNIGMVLRSITSDIPKIEELNLPPIIKDLALTKRGLLLFVGATGSGKSTSLAAMVGHRNRVGSGHIITIEDPIEFVHQHQGCIITQREVGIDTESFDVALRNTLRQAPDVILIGEVRSRETMEHALAFAETGHLCLATLHANNANQAIDRIISFFPSERISQLLMDLSLNLRGIVAQQLVPSRDGEGRRPAIEVLLNTPLLADLIRAGRVNEIKPLMERSEELGMQTFDRALFKLYDDEQISYEAAIRHADSANNLRLMIKLKGELPEEEAAELANDPYAASRLSLAPEGGIAQKGKGS